MHHYNPLVPEILGMVCFAIGVVIFEAVRKVIRPARSLFRVLCGILGFFAALLMILWGVFLLFVG